MNESDRQELARYGVATVYEAAGRTGLIDIPLVQLIPGSRVAGPARTVRCGQGDNLMVHAVMDRGRARRGDRGARTRTRCFNRRVARNSGAGSSGRRYPG